MKNNGICIVEYFRRKLEMLFLQQFLIVFDILTAIGLSSRQESN